MFIGPGQIEAAILLAAFASAGVHAMAQSAPAPQPAAPRIYRSADGQFTVDPPPGWQVRKEEGSNEVTFLSGNVSISIATADTEPGDTVAKWLEVNKQMLMQQCPTAELRGEGKITVADAPGEFITLYCPGPKLPTTVRMAAAIHAGRFYIFNVTSPTAQLDAAQPLIDRIARSFKPGTAESAAK